MKNVSTCFCQIMQLISRHLLCRFGQVDGWVVAHGDPCMDTCCCAFQALKGLQYPISIQLCLG